MPTIPLNVTGASYTSRSRPLSAQRTVNFLPEVQQNASSKSPFVLHSFPGLKAFSVKGGVDRGIFAHQLSLYHVSELELFSVDQAGGSTLLGTISGTDRCIFAGIGSNVIVVTDGKAWQWNGTTLTQVTDADLETPRSVAHLNNQVLYDGDGGRFASSDVGDATSIDGLNYATAESSADGLVRVYVFKQLVYLFGEETTETWFNSGVGAPPFDRVEGGIIPIGLGAIHSVASNDQWIYWLGDDREVYAAQGAVAQKIATSAISHAIAQYDIVDDAVGACFTWEGQSYYLLTFPNADRSWVFSESNQFPWFELSSGTVGGRSVINGYAKAFGRHFVTDHRNGNIYELDGDTYTDDGATVVRTRCTGPIHGELLGAPGKRLEMSRFELILETGTGLVSGQGSDPVVMLQFSDDGGRTFGTELRGKTGKLGEYQIKVEWHALGSFLERIIRIHTSDPVFFSIHGANADIEAGI